MQDSEEIPLHNVTATMADGHTVEHINISRDHMLVHVRIALENGATKVVVTKSGVYTTYPQREPGNPGGLFVQ